MALQGNPASPYRWSDLAEALLESGNLEGGKRCILRAVELGPRMPQILLRAANFDFRAGNSDEALRFGARALALTRDYDLVIFSSYSRMGVDIDAILDRGLPEAARAVASFFQYILAHGTTEQASSSWKWMGSKSLRTDQLADEYAGFLISRGEAGTAARTWAEQMGRREPAYLKTEWLCNGGFEREPSGAHFDWRVTPVEGVEVRRDSGLSPGMSSLRIDFPGTSNLSYSHVSQDVFVVPGTYRFSGVLKTSQISTDQGVGLRIIEGGNTGKLEARTRQLTGSQDWTKVETIFRATQSTGVLEAQVFRAPSAKFDNKIGGTVWITNVKLEKVSASSE